MTDDAMSQRLARGGLDVDNLVVRFGGILAVDNVSLSAPEGRITGLIGPNGAGKTTTFNSCSGLNKPVEGVVSLFGEEVTGLPPQVRAQRGLGRTFQRMNLFNSLTVRENVRMGREAGLAGSRPIRHVWARRNDQHTVGEAADRAIELCGIGPLAERRAGALSTGQRRLVELARVIAGGFRILLLDEPSSGLDKNETEAFGRVLLDLVDREGTGILLVEHDMALVMEVCTFVHVLDFGKTIFEGTTADLAASEQVRAAYLGSEELEVG